MKKASSFITTHEDKKQLENKLIASFMEASKDERFNNLIEKINILQKRTIREKVLAYLHNVSKKTNQK